MARLIHCTLILGRALARSYSKLASICALGNLALEAFAADLAACGLTVFVKEGQCPA